MVSTIWPSRSAPRLACSAGAVDIARAQRHPENTTTLLKGLHELHVGPPSSKFRIIGDPKTAVTTRRVFAEHAADTLAREYPTSDAVQGEHDAESPGVEMEVRGVGTPRQGMLYKHQRALEPLETVGRLDE
jgi:hypothetical protein